MVLFTMSTFTFKDRIGSWTSTFMVSIPRMPGREHTIFERWAVSPGSTSEVSDKTQGHPGSLLPPSPFC